MPTDDDYIPAIPDDGWHDLDTARYFWDDAPYQDQILQDLLDVAKQECLNYINKSDDDLPDVAPANYRMGQLTQARNLWNASKVDPSAGGFGDGSFVIQPKPLDWIVKQILVPKRRIPVVA